jgi:bla regulator protein BlaR1
MRIGIKMDCIKIFDWVIQASLFGSVLVLIIFSIRKISKNKISPAILYYMWLILIIKLVIPFGPQSSISIYNYLNLNYKAETVNSYVNEYSNNTGKGNVNIPTQTINSSNDIIPKGHSNTNLNNKQAFLKKVSFKEILSWVWVSGSLLITIYTVSSLIKMKRNISKNISNRSVQVNRVLEDCEALLKTNNKVQIILTNNITSPSLFGVLSPKILIPTHMVEKLSEKEMKFIILHELCHLKRKDLLLAWLITILKTIYWFNPIILLGLNTMKADCELACDMKVLSYLSPKENIAYGNTIINVLQLINNTKWFPGTTAIIINKNQLKGRINMIGSNKKVNIKTLLLGIMLIVLIGAVCLTGKVSKADSGTGLNNNNNSEIALNEGTKGEASKKNENTQLDITDEVSNDIKAMVDKGNIVMVSDLNSNTNEVLNTARIDTFMDNFKNGKVDQIRIIKYGKEGDKVFPNKLMDLETDGTTLKLFSYDTYSNDKRYKKPLVPDDFIKITKQTYEKGGVRYAIHETKEDPDNMGMTLISFN